MQAFGPVGALDARFTVAVHAQLFTVGAFVATFLDGNGFLGPGRFSDAAKSAREAAFFRLVFAETARPAKFQDLVVILTDGATLFAVVQTGRGQRLGHAGLALQFWATCALRLASLLVVRSDLAGSASPVFEVKEGSLGTWNCKRKCQHVAYKTRTF